MSQSDDMAAIDVYMREQSVKASSDAAKAAYATWRKWYDGLGFWDKSMSSDIYNEARKKRDAFNKLMGAPDLKAAGYTAMTTEDMKKDPPKTPLAVVFDPKKKPLKQGERGMFVTDAQKRLNVHGANPQLNPDGNFGPGTKTAVIAFQKKQGFSTKDQDGIIGPMTWAKLSLAPAPIKTPFTPVAEPTVPTSGGGIFDKIGDIFKSTPAPTSPTSPPIVNSPQVPASSPQVPRPVPTGGSPSPRPVPQSLPRPVPTGSGPVTTIPTSGGGPIVKPPPATVPVQEAGMLSFLSAWPTWAKALLGVGVAAAVVKAVTDDKKKKGSGSRELSSAHESKRALGR